MSLAGTKRVKAVLVVVAALLPWARASGQPSIAVTQVRGLMDEVVRLRVSGLKPRAIATLVAEMPLGGYGWRSSATFRADTSGRIDPAFADPLSGTYSGRDPMGLFWSMIAQPGNMAPSAPLEPVLTTVRVLLRGRQVASVRVSRAWVAPGVSITSVREGQVIGRLFDPGPMRNGKGVVVLSGSEGGFAEWPAALLASRGFTVIAPAYFRTAGRPERLVEIPLEDMKQAMDLLRAQPGVSGRRIAVMGSSKGGELALLLGATYPDDVAAVVSYASGALVGPGLDEGYTGTVSSWSFRGSSLPFARCRPTALFLDQFREQRPIRLRLMNEPCLSDRIATAGAFIPVKNIRGDVLLVTGGNDQTGPAAQAAQIMVAARRSMVQNRTLHLNFPAAGHAIYSAYVPTTRSTVFGHLALGGTPKANAMAQSASWPQVVSFLEQSLGAGTARSPKILR